MEDWDTLSRPRKAPPLRLRSVEKHSPRRHGGHGVLL